MRPASSLRGRAGRAFTLVEILIATGVLALLGALVAEIIGATTHTTRVSGQLVEAAAQARLAFDRIGLDLAGLVKRTDVDFETEGNAADGRTLLMFVSRVSSAGTFSSSSTNRRISLIAYQVAPHRDNVGPDGAKRPCLVRAGLAVKWTDDAFSGLRSDGLPVRFTDGTFPTSLIPQLADYDILAPGIVRMAVGFQLRPDNLAVTLLDGTSPGNAQGQIVYSPPIRSVIPSGGTTTAKYVDPSRIAAVVVGLAVVDLGNLKLLTADQVSALADAFPLSFPANQLPARTWGPIADRPLSLPESIPLSARQAVRIFQRSFPVTPYEGGMP